NVRGLTQNGAQRNWKRHSDIVVHLHLIDPGHLIFDRFFHRDDLAVRLVDVIEAGVEGTGFSRPGRTSHEQDSIRRTQQLFEFFLIVAEETELGQADEQTRFIEHAHDNAFAMVRGNGRNAQINRFLFYFHLNASVLRQTLFRDTHRAGHDLEPADDGGLQTLRRRLHFLEDTVDAKTDAELFVERLEMNIARAELMRFDDQHRNQPDDGRVRFINSNCFGAVANLEAKIDFITYLMLEDVSRFLSCAIIFDQGLADFLRRRTNQLEVALEKKIEAVDGIDIKWIADGEDQTTFAKGHGNDLEASRVRRADLRNDFGRNNDPGEIDPVHLRLGREWARNVAGRNNPIRNQDIEETGSAIKFRARLRDSLARNQPAFFVPFRHISAVGW